MFIRAVAICMGLLGAAPALAQSPAPEPAAPSTAAPLLPPGQNEDGRYTFNRVGDGYLRLDTRTGQVSLCSRHQVGWACQALPDDRTAFEGEIARLQLENGTLKRELLSRGIALPGGIKPPPSERSPQARKPLNPDLDRVMTMVETMWRRLVEMISNLQRDMLDKT